MQILDRGSLVDRMITTVRAKTSAVTYFGPGAFRAFLYAVATELQHLYYKLYQVEQQTDVLSASGASLDAFAAARGMTRAGASGSSVILHFTANAVVAGSGTVVITGTSLTGTGTLFLTELAAGDQVLVGGNQMTVQSVTTNGAAVLTASASVGTLTAFQIQKASVTIPVDPTPLRIADAGGNTFAMSESVTLVPQYTGSTTLVGVGIAGSIATGTNQNVPAGVVRTVLNPSVVPLVTAIVVNPAAAQGGTDGESDAQFRSRIIGLFAGLNQGTRAFYEAQVRLALPRVTRIFVARGTQFNEVKICCATREGTPLSTPEKVTLAAALNQVTPVQTFVTIADMTYLAIDVSFSTTLRPGYTVAQVADALANTMAAYLDWTTWPDAVSVQSDDLLRMASGTEGVDSIKLASFSPMTDVEMASGTVPRVGTVIVTDSASGSTATVASMVNQYPRL